MATLTLKNVPDDLYKALKEAAAKNRRSLNQEAIMRLEQATARQEMRRDPAEIIARLEEFQATLPREYSVALETIDRWKREGRE